MKFLLSALLLILLTGCADVKVRPVSWSNRHQSETEGIRFYRPHPYLLVTPKAAKVDAAASKKKAADASKDVQNAAGSPPAGSPPAGSPTAGSPTAVASNKPKSNASSTTKPPPILFDAKIIWLPEYQDGYAIDFVPGMGVVETDFKLENGWMLTEFGGKVDTKIPETIAAFTGLLDVATKMTLTLAKPEDAPIGPRLYRFIYDDDGKLESLKLFPLPLK